jgi:threonylcarbamoyladenosine tRNA methylthiotransferase CDKAL1
MKKKSKTGNSGVEDTNVSKDFSFADVKVAFITFGCSFNQADSESMAGVAKDFGFNITDSPDDADVVVINSCTVKNIAENKLFRSIRDLKVKGGDKSKKIIIAGCVPQADLSLVKGSLKDFSIIGTTQLGKIGFVIEETLKGNVVHALKRDKNPRLDLPKVRQNRIIDIIPICEGCLDHCAYCKTKHARGGLFSYSPDAIVKQAREAIDDGCKEIWLTSQDCAAYGRDIGTDVTDILKRILALDGDFYVRLGMSNPHLILDILDDLVEVYKHPKMFKFLHVPVQSGSDRVLEAMKRNYHADDFRAIVRRFRKEIPSITISTDIICGFPTESDAEFFKTLDLIRETRPDVVNISRFWKRPDTPAARMLQVPGGKTKDRSTELKFLFDKICRENNKRWVGWKGKMIIDEKGTKKGTWMGHNFAYKQFVVVGDHKIGKVLDVIVKTSSLYYLSAEVLGK